jgi:hypothetical protein
MKTNRTIKRLLFTATFLVAGLMGAMAADPATVPATTSGGAKTLNQDDGVTTELITKGTKVPYLVLPDADLNPSWSAGTDATNVTNLVSTFTWTIPGTISSTTAPTIHYVELDVTGNAGTTGDIVVKENSAASCPGSATTVHVKVVAAPSVSAASVTDGTGSSVCSSGTNGALNVTIPTFSITSSIDASITTPNVKIIATLTFTPLNGTATDLFADKTLSVAGGVVSDADIKTALGATVFNSWGTYKLTIKKVSDTVSRKDISTAGGYFDVSSVSATYAVLKAPVTRSIYHLSNQ